MGIKILEGVEVCGLFSLLIQGSWHKTHLRYSVTIDHGMTTSAGARLSRRSLPLEK